MPKVTVIILNWNGIEHIEGCLKSLARQTYSDCNVVVVDNASTDGSDEQVERDFPDVTLIRNPGNYGFARGNNVGIEYALERGADYVALLNNDTEVEPSWVSELVSAAERKPETGIFGSKMLVFQNRQMVNSTGHVMNSAGMVWDRGYGRIDDDRWCQEAETLGACAGAVLIRRNVLERIGCFDERYFGYYEDADLCVAARRAGFGVRYVPSAIVYHKLSSSFDRVTDFREYLKVRNNYRFFLKVFPLPYVLRQSYRLIKNEVFIFLDLIRARDHRQLKVRRRALTSVVLSLPEIGIRRLKQRIRLGSGSASFLDFVQEGWDFPPVHRPVFDYRVQREAGDTYFAPKVLIGVNDTILGQGWYATEGGGDAYRWTGRFASCFLRRDRSTGSQELRLVVSSPWSRIRPVRLSVRCGDMEPTEFTLGAEQEGWREYRMELGPSNQQGVVEVTLSLDSVFLSEETGEVRDLGVRVRELEIREAA